MARKILCCSVTPATRVTTTRVWVPSAPSSFNEQQQFSQSDTLSKDIEIISAKLDSIRAMLESINQRIERSAKTAEETRNREKIRFKSR